MSTAVDYYNSITVIEAQQNLVKMNIADYPKMSKDGRKKIHREMHKLGNPKHLQKEMDFEEFQKVMRGK